MDEEEYGNRGLQVVNMTEFFNLERYLYSIGDMRLPYPAAFKKIGIFGAAFAVWSLPILLIFGFGDLPFGLFFKTFYLGIVFGVPVLIAMYGAKPFIDGRSVISASWMAAKFIASPHCYTDTNVSTLHKKPSYFIEQNVWISRRRELFDLAQQWELISKK